VFFLAPPPLHQPLRCAVLHPGVSVVGVSATSASELAIERFVVPVVHVRSKGLVVILVFCEDLLVI
jgi:hypothetical protein